MEEAPPGAAASSSSAYPLKAALTRGRSAAWMLRGRPAGRRGCASWWRPPDRRRRRYRSPSPHVAFVRSRWTCWPPGLPRRGPRRDPRAAHRDGAPPPPTTALPSTTASPTSPRTPIRSSPATASRPRCSSRPRHDTAATRFPGIASSLRSWACTPIVHRPGGRAALRGAHGHAPNLLTIDTATAGREIAGSREELEERLGRPVIAFAYPAGLDGDRERRLVAEAGYTAAVTCEPGINVAQTDRFALRRRQIDSRDTLLDFRAKIAGGHDTPLPVPRALPSPALRHGPAARRTGELPLYIELSRCRWRNASTSKRSSTRRRPASPICARRCASPSSCSIAAASRPGSPGSTSSPVSPSTTSPPGCRQHAKRPPAGPRPSPRAPRAGPPPTGSRGRRHPTGRATPEHRCGCRAARPRRERPAESAARPRRRDARARPPRASR